MADVFELQCPCYEFQFTDPEDSFESWNGLRGPAGPAGPPGAPGPGVQLRGPVPSTSDLPATAPSGELWLVGSAAPYDGWFYNGSSWQDAGQIAVGPAGPAGEPGTDGVSPEVTVTEISGGHRVTITDAEGSEAFDVMDGEDGQPGSPGAPGAPGAPGSDGTTFTPSVSSAGVISWTNDGGKANPDPVNIKGPQGDPGSAGAPGAAGSDGTTFTPSVSAAGVISWTNDGGKANPDPVNIKGPQGDTGPTGPAGPGVPTGGSAGQVLAKASGTDYDAEWIDPPSGGGAIYKKTVAILATSGTIATVSDSNITADFVVASIVFANPSAITSDVTWTTAAGSLTLTGTCTNATTADIILVKT